MFGKLTKRLDPDEIVTLVVAGLWMWAGWSTWNDLTGKPKNAPHLMIPGEWRSILWWATAVFAVWGLRLPRRCKLRRFSIAFLALMPSVRLFSYTASWVFSWEIIDRLIPDTVLSGDQNAWASIWVYLALDFMVLLLAKSPWSWGYLHRSKGK